LGPECRGLKFERVYDRITMPLPARFISEIADIGLSISVIQTNRDPREEV